MPYENSCTLASLIFHTLNEILALGIPRYTYGQLVATAFFCILGKEITDKTRHKTECSLRTCTSVPKLNRTQCFQQLGTFHTALTQLRKFTQPRGYPPCGVDGSHSHRSIIYIRILHCTPPSPTVSC